MKLVLIRHGESIWNKENKFTGWTDVDLSEKGITEAKKSGEILKKHGFYFDIAYTSYLVRAKHTLRIVLEKLGNYPQIIETWKLNERHYGALQGLNKKETAKKFSDDQVHLWRRSYDISPPALKKSDKRWPGHDEMYRKLKNPPTSESLKDTVKRVVPYWKKEILPNLASGKKIVISAHGNSLRALIKHIDNISDKEIPNLEIPTGRPLVYEFNKKILPIKHYYLE